MLDIGHGTQHRVLRWRHSLIIGRSRYNVGHHRHDCLTVHSCLHCVCKHSVQTWRNPVVYRRAHSLAFWLDCGGIYHVLREAQKNTGASPVSPAVTRHPARPTYGAKEWMEIGEHGASLQPSRPFSCCCGLNQPRVPENGWVLAILTAFRVALVQRQHVPLSVSSGRFPGAAHEGTPTA
jgi:hypothetical protein